MSDPLVPPRTPERAPLAARYFGRTRLLILLAVFLSGVGLVSYTTLTKELNPNIQIPIVFISTSLPGAGPADVEELVTKPVEEVVSELNGVAKVTSTSQENLSVVTVEFASTVAPETAKQDSQAAVDALTTLPDDAKNPSVQVLDFQNQPNLIIALAALNDDTESLKRFADHAKEALLALPGIERVEMRYRNDDILSVAVAPEKLLEKNLSLSQLTTTISGSVADFPSGTVVGATNRYPLVLEQSAEDTAALAALPLTLNDTLLPLGSLADIRLSPPRDGREAYIATPTHPAARAITLSIFKGDETDTLALKADVDQLLNTLRAPYGDRFTVFALFDGAREIEKSFQQLFRDFALTFFLVFVVLLTFFGFRESLVAAAAIPLTFLGTFIVMLLTGISVNFISLFSLLLALGILVDNAIVIVSAVAQEQRRHHFAATALTLKVFRDYRVVILTTTLTTVFAFLPLLLASGIIGEFIKPIPIVVSTALGLSALIALFLVLPFMALLQETTLPRRVRWFIMGLCISVACIGTITLTGMSVRSLPLILLALLAFVLLILSFRPLLAELAPRVRARTIPSLPLFSLVPLAARYEHFLRGILSSGSARRRTIVFLACFMIFSYALVPLGFVKNEFFPEDDQDSIYISVELPTGTPLSVARARTKELLADLRLTEHALFVAAEIGAIPPTDNTPGRVGTERILYTVHLTQKSERKPTSGEIVTQLNSRYQHYPHGRFAATQLAGGPPAGSDITVKFLGADFETLETLGATLAERLTSEPGVSNIRSTSETTGGKLALHTDPAALARYHITEPEIALSLRAFGNGIPVRDDARINGTTTDIILFLGGAGEAPLADLTRLRIPAGDTLVPLSALGTVRLERTPTVITREDEKRILTVTADVSDPYSVSDKSARVETLVEALALPEGYSWKTGGANEENQKSVRSILLAMLLSAVLIFGTMTLQFDSFRKALIVLLVIPLAVSGVFVVFALTHTPLSFPALIGVLALFGIVVNNSIIMVDKINRNMAAGLPLDEAIAEGAGNRLEPILLTALTTIVGLIPITLSDPIWQGLGGAIIAGLTFSGIAKLFFIPVVYKAWFSPPTHHA